MRKAQLEKYRRRLEKEYDDVVVLIKRSGQAIRAIGPDGPDDSAAQAADAYSKEFLSHQSDTNFSHLGLIENAIRRIEEADFGLCQSCDKKIDAKRLDAVPWAQFCRSCQELSEESKLSEPQRNFMIRS